MSLDARKRVPPSAFFTAGNKTVNAVDIAYFIGAGLQPEPTPRQERALVDRYCTRLNEGGVDVSTDEVWASYRLGSASGYIMAVAASQQVIRTDRGDDMFMAMTTRHANQMRRVGLV